MIKNILFILNLGIVLHQANAYGAPVKVDEATVEHGTYYVGTVYGREDYANHVNTTLNAFSIMKTEVTFRFYYELRQWAEQQGYQLDNACNGAVFEDCLPPEQDRGAHPVTNVSWWDAILFANALSARQGLPPYYLSADGQPLKSVPENGVALPVPTNSNASGYRLPTRAEWEVAARGGLPGLQEGSYGSLFSGSDDAQRVANFPSQDATTFGTQPVASKHPNALGLYDMSGNVSEWLNEAYQVVGGNTMFYFCGGGYLAQTSLAASCDVHTPGFMMSDIGFRLVRTLPAGAERQPGTQ